MNRYYEILKITPSATLEEIKKSYRSLALKWHPDRHQDQKEAAEKKFKEIKEAYEVLSDPEKKKIYDQFGEAGLAARGGSGFPNGFPSGVPGGFPSGFPGGFQSTFQLDPRIIEGLFGAGFSGGGGFGRPTAVYSVDCTLEQLYVGETRKIEVGGKLYEINIQPGYRDGVKIRFPEAITTPHLKQDLVFVIHEQPHSMFERKGSDLIHKVTLSLRQALVGCIIAIPTLDGRTLRHTIRRVIEPQMIDTIPGEGMPDSKNPTKKGNLILVFKIEFPATLTPAQKEQLNAIL